MQGTRNQQNAKCKNIIEEDVYLNLNKLLVKEFRQ